MNRVRIALLAIALVCTAMACQTATEESVPQEAAPIRVQVAPVRRGDIADVLDVMGQTEARTVLRLASPVAGRITMLTVQPGDQLAEGAVAARVIPLENEAAEHGFALLERADALSAAEKETVRKLRDEIGGDVPLRSPFPAVVAERLHNPNEQVAPSDVLLELFDPRSLYVVAQVPATAASGIHAGQPVEIRAGDSEVAGQVEAVVTALAAQALTLPVRVALTAPLQPPLLHAAVECRITVAQHSGALLIPRSALISSTATRRGTVMVAVNGRAARRDVQLGLRTAKEVEVTAGLGSDDLVLTRGQYALPDGTRVEASMTPATAQPDAKPPEPSQRDNE
ncbi:MAG: HlyD family efflux transporter periplasmic adaptor subunit [Candidatus Binatia bacterium]|jgi:pyruvate/2-oxoglutarate dehydrogenase complex dihydrolipoamide acyltransferase (E2) component